MRKIPERKSPNGILRVGEYIRYSTEEQQKHSYSEEMQRDECWEKFRRVYGDIPVVVRQFSDLAHTGALRIQDPENPNQDYRRGLTDLLQAAIREELDLVLCYAQDRLARDEYMWHYMRAMVFEKTGTRVLFARENHDIFTPEGRVLSTLQAMTAEMELDKIRANVAAGCRRRVHEGYQGVSPPYGWMRDPDQIPQPRERRRVVRDDAQGAILLEIRDRYLSGWLTMEICQDLHKRGIPAPSGQLTWTTSGLLKVLRNPFHAGLVKYHKEVHPGAHAALRYWSPEDHEYLKQRIAERATKSAHSRRLEKYLLSSALFCEHCGRTMVGGLDYRREHRFYTCTRTKEGGEHIARVASHRGQRVQCPRPWVRADKLEEALRQAISELARSTQVQAAAQQKLEQALDNADDRLNTELVAVQRDLQKVADGFSKLFALLEDGSITEAEFQSENEKRRAQQEALAARQKDVESQLSLRRNRKQELERALAILRDFDNLWEAMTRSERRQLILEIDPHITVRREGDFTIATLRPTFAEPIELRFARSQRESRKRGPDASLTPRQLALLALWDDGLEIDEIARRFDVGIESVKGCITGILLRLTVETLDEALELKRDVIARCRPTLPLDGRVKQRDKNKPDLLTKPLLEVVKLLAQGKRGKDIAEILGKDKSTISRQIVAARSRLHASSIEEAIEKAVELGLVEQTEEDKAAFEPPLIRPHLQRVLELDRAGKSVDEIAEELGVKPSSANVYRKKVRKLARELEI
ncbi:MAG: recombinase family protein [Armatimonadetes bacterium]|nr:recombinase family protein [Armatimonadota bacterium]